MVEPDHGWDGPKWTTGFVVQVALTSLLLLANAGFPFNDFAI
jgi:hypothetical protein